MLQALRGLSRIECLEDCVVWCPAENSCEPPTSCLRLATSSSFIPAPFRHVLGQLISARTRFFTFAPQKPYLISGNTQVLVRKLVVIFKGCFASLSWARQHAR